MSPTPSDTLLTRLNFLGLDDDARARLIEAGPVIATHLETALSAFYDKIAATPAAAGFFSGRPQMDRAKSKQVAHWQSIISGEFNDSYMQSSAHVGLVHARIGLEPRWHIGGYGLIIETLVRG